MAIVGICDVDHNGQYLRRDTQEGLNGPRRRYVSSGKRGFCSAYQSVLLHRALITVAVERHWLRYPRVAADGNGALKY